MLLLALLLAQPYPQIMVERPLLLPAGSLELGVLANYTGADGASGEAAAVGLEYGLTSSVQIGGYVALPINPGFGFGSFGGSALIGLSKFSALRLDAGYDRIAITGSEAIDGGTVTFDKVYLGVVYGGIGAPFRKEISPGIAFVSGETGAFRVAQFVNAGQDGLTLYGGSALGGFNEADLFSISHNVSGGGDLTIAHVTLPVGIQMQFADQVAVTVHAAYHLQISSNNSTQTEHFLPVGFDAVLSPSRDLDVGISFSFAGPIAASAGDVPGYFEEKFAAVWVRVRSL